MRLDHFLVNEGFFESRSKAQLAIQRSCVFLNGFPVTQKSFLVNEGDEVVVQALPVSYVGIGGEKLEPAIRKYPLSEGFYALDIGAGTGGFTDCLLQHGAGKVFAVDIGNGQLHSSLQNNPKVEAFENTDIRTFSSQSCLPGSMDIVSVDVSFISLSAILPFWRRFLKPGGLVFALLKPQFQMQQRKKIRGGIVKSDSERKKMLSEFIELAAIEDFRLEEVFPTSADGKTKNIEFMMVFSFVPQATYKHG
jgi:23S rRNA (cytidine1920-2'-O)/16S rRNA (cytidine1409-2'-O)-methyltransferase